MAMRIWLSFCVAVTTYISIYQNNNSYYSHMAMGQGHQEGQCIDSECGGPCHIAVESQVYKSSSAQGPTPPFNCSNSCFLERAVYASNSYEESAFVLNTDKLLSSIENAFVRSFQGGNDTAKLPAYSFPEISDRTAEVYIVAKGGEKTAAEFNAYGSCSKESGELQMNARKLSTKIHAKNEINC
jgi:hypothetical protein